MVGGPQGSPCRRVLARIVVPSARARPPAAPIATRGDSGRNGVHDRQMRRHTRAEPRCGAAPGAPGARGLATTMRGGACSKAVVRPTARGTALIDVFSHDHPCICMAIYHGEHTHCCARQRGRVRGGVVRRRLKRTEIPEWRLSKSEKRKYEDRAKPLHIELF